MRKARRAAVIGVTAATGFALVSCASSKQQTPTAHRDNSGVTVTVHLTRTSGGSVLKATFSPDRPGFHLYSISLPDAGIKGLGIPTRLSVQGGLASSGSVSADKPIELLNLPDLDAQLPVYPNGPVTLTLPVRTTGSNHADVVVSYGACSTGTCMMPVTNQLIPLDLS